jgi:hypothetical protein
MWYSTKRTKVQLGLRRASRANAPHYPVIIRSGSPTAASSLHLDQSAAAITSAPRAHQFHKHPRLANLFSQFTMIMSEKQIIRDCSHAGSWYSDSKSRLNSELDGWLAAVDTPVTCIGPRSDGEELQELPVPGARMIIAPWVSSYSANSICQSH